MQSRFFRTRDGLRLHYISHPCVDAACTSYCVLLHGFTNDAHVWDALAAGLQRTHHVVALDQRGHGDSDWDSACQYSHWQLADDLQQFLDELEGDQNAAPVIHIVGHSLGGRVALLALETARRPVASLTIIDAGPQVGAEAAARLVNDVMQLPAHYPDAAAFYASLARIYVMADSAALAHMASFGLRMRGGRLVAKTDPAFTPGIWHKTPELQQMHKDRGELSEQLWNALRSLALPVHILRGQASSILEPALATKMVHALGERAQLSVVPRAGHAVMLDNPAASAALIAAFIERAGKGAATVQAATGLNRKRT